MLDALKGLIFETESGPQAPAKPAPAAPTVSGSAPTARPVDDQFVTALRNAIKARSSAFTALLATADKLSNVIPDSTMRLKAAFATLEGRGLKEILGAIDVHAADLESQRMQFSRQAEDAMKREVGAKQAELDAIDPAIQVAQSQIEALSRQISSLNETIAQKSARKAELTTEIASETARFDTAKQQFETALTVVKGELDGQKAIIQSALA
jgi:chromosome segregation ATPase